ncbi:M20 metallopeptidase family protein [Clostridium luticellarii]|jgi:amidohydrolase|uniref:N-acyl-L-amino acid amidohydrolase n=1 Tax=Clostridium luticellarii TaxID=1691940 RepID=A0A2T0BSJ0_9CLOT|nr:amidohydrolase [Clostridium luticellarii]MCI1945646.1 amidohydrolase [Clostridium luticellarii]MCI1968463.1 amidohydrolase [Clostridium luticellarii]MCI1996520.1 amidohydrolase [Clostridium luticellarii]PRR86854.1 N-acyl-L-amino acid amidohydrolase [Clostridium luticellarii]
MNTVQVEDVGDLKELAEKYYPEVVEFRRYFHMHPEISKREFNTQKKIIEILGTLKELDIRKAGGTGVIADLKGGKPGKTIAIRADIDALAIDDECGKPYQSQNPGACHACGHDGHISMLLGVAKILYEVRDKIKGNIRFIFQPSEEEVSDGSGADAIIKDGGLDGVDAVIGAHLWQPLKIGTVGISSGPMMGASDEFEISIEGKAGHASMPQQTIDSILTASEVVVALNTIVGRDVDPMKQAVVSVGVFNSGRVYNAIAGKAVLKGTIRTLDEEIRKQVFIHIKKIVEHISEMTGAHCHIKKNVCTYVVDNDPQVTDIVLKAGREIIGDKAHPINPFMSSEDFSYYLQKIPGCFIFVGVGNREKGIIYPQHHPKYDIDEKALCYGMEVMSNAALKLLEKF